MIVKPFRQASIKKPKIFIRENKDVTLTFPMSESEAFPKVIHKNSLAEAQFRARAKEISSHCKALGVTYSGFFVSPDVAIVHEKRHGVDEVMKFTWISGVLLITHQPYERKQGNSHAPSSYR